MHKASQKHNHMANEWKTILRKVQTAFRPIYKYVEHKKSAHYLQLFFYFSGDNQSRHPRNFALYCFCIWSFHFWPWGSTSYLQIGQGLKTQSSMYSSPLSPVPSNLKKKSLTKKTVYQKKLSQTKKILRKNPNFS